MNKTTPHTTNLPGVPVFPGRNTPLVQTGPPKNVPAPAPAIPVPTPAPSESKKEK